MATQYQQGAWNSSSILQGYGLMAVIGPTEPTPADIKRLNSRSGGAHAGHGNWMQTFNPRPVIKDGPPTKVYDYGQGGDVVVRSRLPGLAQRKVTKFRGLKKSPKVILKLGSAMDADGIQEIVAKKDEPKDDILEKNRKNSDASMPPLSPVESVYFKAESEAGSEFPPLPDQSYRNTLGPIPGQRLIAYNDAETKWITNKIYKPKKKYSYGVNQGSDSDQDMT